MSDQTPRIVVPREELDEALADVEKFRGYLGMADRLVERRGRERDAARTELDALKREIFDALAAFDYTPTLPGGWLADRIRSIAKGETRSEETAASRALRDIDPDLVANLSHLGDRYGPLGVALAAAQLTDRGVLIHELTHDPVLEPQPAQDSDPGPDDPNAPYWPKKPAPRTLLGWTVPDHVTFQEGSIGVFVTCPKHAFGPLTENYLNAAEGDERVGTFLMRHAHGHVVEHESGSDW